jgi:urea carboxylase
MKDMVLPSRIVHLPMAFDERWTHEALDKYAKSVRAEAPYLPSNVEYVAANNGLASKEDVRRIVFEASYLVLGLGDVYLGAPCAVPINPLHRCGVLAVGEGRTPQAQPVMQGGPKAPRSGGGHARPAVSAVSEAAAQG